MNIFGHGLNGLLTFYLTCHPGTGTFNIFWFICLLHVAVFVALTHSLPICSSSVLFLYCVFACVVLWFVVYIVLSLQLELANSQIRHPLSFTQLNSSNSKTRTDSFENKEDGKVGHVSFHSTFNPFSANHHYSGFQSVRPL